jgi:hypothetical protein
VRARLRHQQQLDQFFVRVGQRAPEHCARRQRFRQPEPQLAVGKAVARYRLRRQPGGLGRAFGNRRVFGEMQQTAHAGLNNHGHQNSTNTCGSWSALPRR